MQWGAPHRKADVQAVTKDNADVPKGVNQKLLCPSCHFCCQEEATKKASSHPHRPYDDAPQQGPRSSGRRKPLHRPEGERGQRSGGLIDEKGQKAEGQASDRINALLSFYPKLRPFEQVEAVAHKGQQMHVEGLRLIKVAGMAGAGDDDLQAQRPKGTERSGTG